MIDDAVVFIVLAVFSHLAAIGLCNPPAGQIFLGHRILEIPDRMHPAHPPRHGADQLVTKPSSMHVAA